MLGIDKLSSCSKFLESKIFILIIGLLTMLCWYINSLYVTASTFGIILILELIFKSKLYSFPAMLGLVFAGYKKYSMSFKDYGLYVMIGILLFAIILFLIRFIQNRHYIKQRIKGCSILYTTLLLSIPMFVSIINSPVKPITLAHTALWILNAVIVLVVLYGIPNTKEAKEKVCFSFVIFMYVILIQIVIKAIDYLKVYQYILLITQKQFNLGWNLANHAIIGVNIGIIGSMYLFFYIKNAFYKFFCIFSALFGISANFFVFCRGGLIGIFMSVILISILLAFIYKTEWKKNLLYYILYICLISIFCIFISKTSVGMSIIERAKNIGFKGNGRKPIYDLAISLFKDNKFIGTGWGSSAYYIKPLYFVTNYHNWFLQMLATCGIFGVVCLGIYLVDIFRLNKYQYKDIFTWIVFIIVLYFLVHGAVDTVLFSKNFHFFLTIVVAMIKLPKEESIQQIVSNKEQYSQINI